MQNKKYVCAMFPYPSGRLHMGHARNYAIADALAAHYRRKGFQTLFPMGWDSFGLPAEKAAAEHGADPARWTRDNIAAMKTQMERMGFRFDWSREISTCEPEYFKHSQAIFCALHQAGHLYKADKEVWFDPVDNDVLANEQVVDGICWRSGAKAEKRTMKMWHARVSAMARELSCDLDKLDWTPEAAARQKAWIGYDPETGQSRLHDWCIARQRRWGTPIPVACCACCGEHCANPETLPWPVLPANPTPEELEVPCPKCGKPARRSQETLDTFWDSAWYFLRYPSLGEPESASAPVTAQGCAWAPVDVYIGGIEHATMHLLFARWMTRALKACAFPALPDEPFRTYVAQGMVKAKAYRRAEPGGAWVAPSQARRVTDADGRETLVDAHGKPVECVGVIKMSKSKLNGEDPERAAAQWGREAVNLALLFAAPFCNDIVWDERSCKGPRKFLDDLASAAASAASGNGSAPDPEAAAERAKHAAAWDAAWEKLEGLNAALGWSMRLLSCAKHALANGNAAEARACVLEICRQAWPCAPQACSAAAKAIDPNWDCMAPAESSRAGPVQECSAQINGKMFGRAAIPAGATEQEAFERAKAQIPRFSEACMGKTVERLVYKPGRALNAVLSP